MENLLIIPIILLLTITGAFLQSIISAISERIKDKYRPNEKTKTLLSVLFVFILIKSTLLENGFSSQEIVMMALIIMIFSMSTNNILLAFFRSMDSGDIDETT